MKLLFVQGTKGLAANHNRKFYFPDRNSHITEGVYECTVTNDKETYAFVKCKPVKTVKPTVEQLANLITDTDGDDYINVYQIGTSFIIFRDLERDIRIEYMTPSGKVELITEIVNRIQYRSMYALYATEKFTKVISDKDVEKHIIFNKAATLTEDMILQMAIAAKSRHGRYCDIKKVTLIDDKYLAVDSSFYTYNDVSLYYYNADTDEIIEMPHNFMDELKDKKARDISLDKINDFCLEHHIAMRYVDYNAKDTDHVLDITTTFMGETIHVKCLNGHIPYKDFTQEEIDTVETSFKELEAYRKRVGKNISKSMIPEMTKLAPRKILGIS